MPRRRRPKRSRQPSPPLRASIGERTNWKPPMKEVQPEGRAPRSHEQPTPEQALVNAPDLAAILAVISALPRLAAELAFRMASRADARVELLPGGPATLVFTTDGRLQGLFVLPMTEGRARQLLGRARPPRDAFVERAYEQHRAPTATPEDRLLDAEATCA